MCAIPFRLDHHWLYALVSSFQAKNDVSFIFARGSVRVRRSVVGPYRVGLADKVRVSVNK